MQCTKTNGMQQSSAKGKFIATSVCIKNQERSQINNLTFMS